MKNENISKIDNYQEIQDSVLALNVFYKTAYYTEIRNQISVDIDTFLSNLGGVTGVFMGIYLLSIIEIPELMFELILKIFD